VLTVSLSPFGDVCSIANKKHLLQGVFCTLCPSAIYRERSELLIDECIIPHAILKLEPTLGTHEIHTNRSTHLQT